MTTNEKLPSDPASRPRPVSWAVALAGTCRGIAIFQTLCRQSPWRALYHLLLLTLLLGMGVAAANVMRYRPLIERTEQRFGAQFGTIRLGKDGIRPSNAPETPRSFDVTGDAVLRYCPDARRNPGIDFSKEKRVQVLWYPWCFFTVTPMENGRALVAECRPGGGNRMAVLAVSELDMWLTARLSMAPENLGPFRTDGAALLTSQQLGSMASAMLALWTWSSCGFGWWGLAILVTLIFVGLFRWTRNGRFSDLGYRDMWVMALYVSMPPLLVAAIWQALDLPLLQSDTVYVLGFLIYFLTAIRQFDHEGISHDAEQ